MKVVHLSSEVAPFSKTGGLADVAGALPDALARLGADVTVISPYYPSVCCAAKTEVKASVSVRGASVSVRRLPGPGLVRHLFLDEPAAFNRPCLYGEQGKDYPDNAERFSLFCRAALETVSKLGLAPDVIHCHDWQTSLVPLYLTESYAGAPLSRTKTVLTIHNLGYQGNFPKEKFRLLGLPERLFSPAGVEYYNQVSFLKAGLLFANRLTTVSPTYAREILTPELGFGFDGILKSREPDLSGILNGIDTACWNPAADPALARPFSAENPSGKEAGKRALLTELGLSGGDAPLFSAVTRLAGQKGIDLITGRIPALVRAGARVAVLGTGEPEHERALAALAGKHPSRVSARICFSEELAHRIYAGADFFLMPSRYEPCGLGQMLALRYGTLPIASRTGGLADTVIDMSENPGAGNGFLFERGDEPGFGAALERALALYAHPERLALVRGRGMRADFSWDARAGEYLALYRATSSRTESLS